MFRLLDMNLQNRAFAMHISIKCQKGCADRDPVFDTYMYYSLTYWYAFI